MVKNLNTILGSIIAGLVIAKIQPNIIIWLSIALFIILFLINILFGPKDKIKITSLKQDFFNQPYKFIFRVENISDKPNSIKQTVSMKCLTIPLNKSILYGEKRKCTFSIKETDKSIDPHKAKVFEAVTTDDFSQLFVSKFRKFTIYPNRGKKAFIFSVGPSMREVNCFQFYMERFLYQFFKRIPKNQLKKT